MNPNVENTCIEMFEQRGFLISSNNEEHIIAQKKEGKKEGKKDGKKDGKKNIKSKICAFKTINDKVNVESIKKYMNDLNDLGIKHCIIIYKEGITSSAKQIIATSIDTKIEVFLESDLHFNKTKHRLVPEHIALSKTDSINFKKKYGTKLPAILKTDPISRFYNFQRGFIIKIIRKNGFVSYRVVK